MPKRMTPQQRAERDAVIADLLDANRGLVMRQVVEVASELAEEAKGCRALAQDAQIALEVARRLDPVIEIPEPWDSILDGVVFGVALAGAGIYRAAMRGRDRARGKAPGFELATGVTVQQHVERFGGKYAAGLKRDAQQRLQRARR